MAHTPINTTAPTVSVIVPVYNAEAMIPSLLTALKNQTFRHYEALFVDDGSTDATRVLLEEAAALDSRFKILTQEHAGPGAARNTALDAALGRYISFIDADDTPAPELLELALRKARGTKADIVIFQADYSVEGEEENFSALQRWDADAFPNVFTLAAYQDTAFENFRNTLWNKFFSHEFIEKNHLRFPVLNHSEDLPFTCTALVLAKRIALLNEVLYTHRVGLSTNQAHNKEQAPIDFFEACFQFNQFLHTLLLYKDLRVCYENWIGRCVVENVLKIRTAEAFKIVFEFLQADGLAQLELTDLKEEEFHNPTLYRALTIIATADLATATFELKQIEIDHQNEKARQRYRSLRESSAFTVGEKIPTGLRKFFVKE